jgi:hypothetical protein
MFKPMAPKLGDGLMEIEIVESQHDGLSLILKSSSGFFAEKSYPKHQIGSILDQFMVLASLPVITKDVADSISL